VHFRGLDVSHTVCIRIKYVREWWSSIEEKCNKWWSFTVHNALPENETTTVLTVVRIAQYCSVNEHGHIYFHYTHMQYFYPSNISYIIIVRKHTTRTCIWLNPAYVVKAVMAFVQINALLTRIRSKILPLIPRWYEQNLDVSFADWIIAVKKNIQLNKILHNACVH
jgi:hypothetical protein